MRLTLIPVVPLAGITACYFCLVDIPLYKRVIAAMSSILLLLMIPCAFAIGFVTDSHSVAREALGTIFLLLPAGALFFMAFTLFHVRTWMNVLQVPNLVFGVIGLYFMLLGPMG